LTQSEQEMMKVGHQVNFLMFGAGASTLQANWPQQLKARRPDERARFSDSKPSISSDLRDASPKRGLPMMHSAPEVLRPCSD
jgi:hypothetical protein